MLRDQGFLLYMLIAARRVVESVSGVARGDFDADREKRDSVVLQIGNIGEAANHVSESYRAQHPEIPWGQIIAMRHRVFHGYEAIDWDRVWEIARELVPQLLDLLEPLVPPEQPE